jgi:predicted O-methyltransferase YrrM
MGLLRRTARAVLGKKPKEPPADNVVEIASLLGGQVGDCVHLPLIPRDEGGQGSARTEFAAASVLERVILGALVRGERAMRIFEIGTFRGVTALAMALNAPPGAELVTLDLPPELSPEQVAASFYTGSQSSGFHRMAREKVDRQVGVLLADYSGDCRVRQVFGDAATFDFKPYAPVDLFFVDGCHQYEGALRDTQSAWQCLKPGGLLVWHDYGWASVRRAIHDSDMNSPVTWVRGTSLAFARKPS